MPAVKNHAVKTFSRALYFSMFVLVYYDTHDNIHHHHLVAVVSRGCAKASASRLQVSLSGAVLPDCVAPVFVQVVSPPLGWSPLSCFLFVWSPSHDT